MGDDEATRGTGSTQRYAILVVDDEQDVLDSLQDLLAACIDGVRVHVATCAIEGLRLLAQHPIDLVISDYKMPGMNGLEFLARAQEAWPEVPCVLVTACPELEVAVRADSETNIQSFIVKPFEPEDVIRTVQGILGCREIRRALASAHATEPLHKADVKS